MEKDIQGIPIVADQDLPEETVSELVGEIIETWEWEGRRLGRIELASDGRFIHALVFEKPSVIRFSATDGGEAACN